MASWVHYDESQHIFNGKIKNIKASILANGSKIDSTIWILSKLYIKIMLELNKIHSCQA